MCRMTNVIICRGFKAGSCFNPYRSAGLENAGLSENGMGELRLKC